MRVCQFHHSGNRREVLYLNRDGKVNSAVYRRYTGSGTEPDDEDTPSAVFAFNRATQAPGSLIRANVEPPTRAFGMNNRGALYVYLSVSETKMRQTGQIW